MTRQRRPGSLRSAYGLPEDSGGFIGTPDEVFDFFGALELTAAERLTLQALLGKWGRTPATLVEVSLGEMRRVSGASKGYQSGVVKTLLTKFRPAILIERPRRTDGGARRYDLAPFLREFSAWRRAGSGAPFRVRPGERRGSAE